jgi:hypothetical protein
MNEVIQIPRRCDFVLDDHIKCQSRNAIWVDGFQGNLCLVHKAGWDQARAKHPAFRSKQQP